MKLTPWNARYLVGRVQQGVSASFNRNLPGKIAMNNDKINFVMINGPLGVGKSWVANHLKDHVAATSRTIVHQVSFQDVLRKGMMTLLGVPGANYDEFKKSNYHGLSGRQWMIKCSEEFMKSVDELIFSKILHRHMEDIILISPVGTRTLFVADSWGFESEGAYFRVQPDVNCLTCCIEPPNMVERRGRPWIPEDSRYNLADFCGIVQPDSTRMLQAIIAALNRRGWI